MKNVNISTNGNIVDCGCGWGEFCDSHKVQSMFRNVVTHHERPENLHQHFNYRLANEMQVFRRCVFMQRWILAQQQLDSMLREGLISLQAAATIDNRVVDIHIVAK